MNAYLVDEGVLIKKGEREFEQYAIVYDKKYGYYDECQYHVKDLEKAIADANQHINESNYNAYAVVTITSLPDDYDFGNDWLQNEYYGVDAIVYSIARIDGKIIKDFIKRKEQTC